MLNRRRLFAHARLLELLLEATLALAREPHLFQRHCHLRLGLARLALQGLHLRCQAAALVGKLLREVAVALGGRSLKRAHARLCTREPPLMAR